MQRTPLTLAGVDRPNARTHHLFWRLQLIGWMLLIPVSTGAALFLLKNLGLVLLVGVVRQVIGLGVTLGLWRLYRRWPAEDFKFTPHAWKIVLACVAATLADTVATELCRLGAGLPSPPAVIDHGSLVMRLAIYAGWSALYFMIRQEVTAHATALRLARAEAANREAELQLLRAQVNPHFLFNALNTIIYEAEQNPSAVGDTTRAVADYLRYSLSHGAHHAPLGHELNAMGNYLRVERATHGAPRLEWALEATDEARLAFVPTALIQPLVENAVKYGLRTSPPPLRLRIDARVEAGEVVVSVENSGTWVDRGARGKKHDSTGIGLGNLRRRLALLCGASARLDITTLPGLVRVEVRIPPLPAPASEGS